jgi:hypothetical protein
MLTEMYVYKILKNSITSLCLSYSSQQSHEVWDVVHNLHIKEERLRIVIGLHLDKHMVAKIQSQGN